MSFRYVLGTDECPDWADAAAKTGKGLAKKFIWNGPNKLIIMPGVPFEEIEAFFDDRDEFWVEPIRSWSIYLPGSKSGIHADNIDQLRYLTGQGV